MLINSKGY